MAKPIWGSFFGRDTSAIPSGGGSVQEGILAAVAALASGTNPDGTPFSLPVSQGTVAAANVLLGQSSVTATQAATTFLTIPQGRTWSGTVTVSTSVQNAGANAVAGLAQGVVSVAGAGSTPANGSLFTVSAEAGANVAAGTVGSQGNNSASIPLVVVAPAGNAVTLQLATTVTGTHGTVSVTAAGALE